MSRQLKGYSNLNSLERTTNMPSRKRNKGKKRRAKKMETTTEARLPKERTDDNNDTPSGWHNDIPQCHHGFDPLPLPIDDDRPLEHFMTAYEDQLDGLRMMSRILNNAYSLDRLEDLYTLIMIPISSIISNSDNGFLNSIDNRQIVTSLLLDIGTNMILFDENLDRIIHVMGSILILDQYQGNGDYSSARFLASKKFNRIRDGNERDVIKFFNKRIPCECLQDRYEKVRRNVPKIGRCWMCRHEVVRSKLMVCGRCKVAHYCCRECQIEDYPSHKDSCHLYVNGKMYGMQKVDCSKDV